MNDSLQSILVRRLREYITKNDVGARNLTARLVTEFFPTNGKPRGNVMATFRATLDRLDQNQYEDWFRHAFT